MGSQISLGMRTERPWTCQLYEKELQAAGVMVTSGATTVLGGFVTEKEILKNQSITVGVIVEEVAASQTYMKGCQEGVCDATEN